MTIAEEIIIGGMLGFLVGLTGVGGAALAVPSLVLVLGISTVNAIATTFPFMAIIKLFGFLQHRHQGTYHLPLGLALLTGSIPGTVLGVLTLSLLFDRFGEDLDRWLNFSIGAVIIAGVGVLFVKTESTIRDSCVQYEVFGRSQWLRGVALGFPIGVVIGATSVGAGSLMITLILLVYRMGAAKVIGSTIGVSLILMVIGSIGYSRTDLVDFWAVLYLSIGGVPGVIVGSKLINSVSQKVLLRLVGLTVMVAGLGLIGKGIQASL